MVNSELSYSALLRGFHEWKTGIRYEALGNEERLISLRNLTLKTPNPNNDYHLVPSKFQLIIPIS